jgi:voltage-gated potassium channel Kch
LLLGLFFIAVGAGVDFTLLAAQPGNVAMLIAGIIVAKFAVLVVLGKVFRLEWKATWLFAFALAQGGEFCFVLLSMAGGQGLLGEEVTKPLVAAVAISMALTPLLLLINEKLVQPRYARTRAERKADEIDEHDNPVILAGFGRVGHIIGRLLRANGFGVTVLDNDPDQVEMLARFGLKAFYGDATRRDLLVSAGAERARLFICAIDNEEKSLEVIDLVKRDFPNMRIVARAVSRQHAYELMNRGVEKVHRDTLAGALDLGFDSLRDLGFRANQAHRATRLFKSYDEAGLRELAKISGQDDYVSIARKHVQNLEGIFRDDQKRFATVRDDAWQLELPRPEE